MSEAVLYLALMEVSCLFEIQQMTLFRHRTHPRHQSLSHIAKWSGILAKVDAGQYFRVVDWCPDTWS